MPDSHPPPRRRPRVGATLWLPLTALRSAAAHRRPRRFVVGLLVAMTAMAGLTIAAPAANAGLEVTATDGRVFRTLPDYCYRDFGTWRPPNFPADWPTGLKVVQLANFYEPPGKFVWSSHPNPCDPPAGYAWDYNSPCTVGGFACIPVAFGTWSSGTTYRLVRQVLTSSIPSPIQNPPPAPTPCPAPTVKNGSFESGATSWSPWGAATIAPGAAGGASSVQLSGASGTEQTVSCLAPNTTYTLTGFGKVGSSGLLCIGAKQHDAAGTDARQCSNSTAWTRRQVTFTTGPTNTSARLYFFRPGAGTAYGDVMSLRVAAPLPTPTNGSFETNTTFGWTITASATVTATAPAAGGAALQHNGWSRAEQTVSGLTPNTLYTLTGAGKVATNGQICIGVKQFDAANSEPYRCLSNTSWTTTGVTFTTGPSNTSARIYVYRPNPGTAYSDNVVLQRAVPGVDCGPSGYLTSSVVTALVNGGRVSAADPCVLAGTAQPLQIVVAGPPFGTLRGAVDNALWEVHEKQEVLEPAVNRYSMCLKLRGRSIVTSGGGKQEGYAEITQRICRSYDWVGLRWVLSDGTYDTTAKQWRPPPSPTIDTVTTATLVGLANGGPGSSGVTRAALAPFNGGANGVWEVQFQAIVYVGLGVPNSGGAFVGFQRSVQKDYRLAVTDIPAPTR